MRSRVLTTLAASILGALVAGCGSGGLQLPTDPAGTALFEQAEQAAAEENWSEAATAYDTLLRNYPTSPHLAEARLGLGRAYYEQDRSDRYLLSIEAFRNFMTYHPSHDQVDYAQLMISLGYMGLMRSSDRDQSNTRRALDAFEVFFEDYPNSQHREFALERMQEALDTVAQHELQVAGWQLDQGLYAAAASRAQYALRKYPETGYRCHLLYTLAEALRRDGDSEGASVYYQQVAQEFPTCEYVDEARRRMETIREVGGD